MHVLFSFYLTGPAEPLRQQALNSLYQAVAPGTRVNKQRQARAFLTFALCYDVDYLSPSVSDVVMYTRFMANSYSSPSSTKNYLSGAKYWVTTHGGDPSAFSSIEVAEIIKAVTSESTHVPQQAPPLLPADLRIICAYLDAHLHVHMAIKPCILISYACMLRSSNVVSPNLTVWAGAHTLLARDVRFNNGGLNVIIRSSKSKASQAPTLLRVEPADHALVCPVRAWLEYAREVTIQPLGPAFLTDRGAPLTAAPVVEAMRSALQAAGAPNVARVSMHSLRRGAVQAAQAGGASREEIMKHGIWSSASGLGYYLKPASSEVPRVLSASLAD